MQDIEYIEKNGWKRIPSFPKYEASAGGVIRNAETGEILKQYLSKGYLHVSVRKRVYRFTVGVHRLVTEAFHGTPPSKRHLAAHWDGNKQNNSPHNLRWATVRENCADATRHRIERHRQKSEMKNA